jgi:transposase
MDRQTLRDWVIRYNAHGLDGLADQWGDGRPPRLSPGEKSELVAIVLAGPDPEASGISAFTREDLVRICKERFGKILHVTSMGRILRELGLSRRRRGPATRKKTRPRRRPLKRAPALFRKIQYTHRNKRIRLFFQDEARIGQKGRVCRVWWKRGERPPGLCDKRFTFAYIFAAVEPGTDNAFALVLPSVGTEAMQAFLDDFAKTIAPDEHVVMVLDQAGWHGTAALRVPDCITLMPLPPYSPELNPVEWVWEYMKDSTSRDLRRAAGPSWPCTTLRKAGSISATKS